MIHDLRAAKSCMAIRTAGESAWAITASCMPLTIRLKPSTNADQKWFKSLCGTGVVDFAAKAAADFVKTFPCSRVGGAGYIPRWKAPFPHVPLIERRRRQSGTGTGAPFVAMVQTARSWGIETTLNSYHSRAYSAFWPSSKSITMKGRPSCSPKS